MEDERRRLPRYPFIASAELLEENSGSRMNTRISDLSLSGCSVDTINPLPDGTLVHLKIFTESHCTRKWRLWLPEATEQTNTAHG
jgi:hypothetical protein